MSVQNDWQLDLHWRSTEDNGGITVGLFFFFYFVVFVVHSYTSTFIPSHLTLEQDRKRCCVCPGTPETAVHLWQTSPPPSEPVPRHSRHQSADTGTPEHADTHSVRMWGHSQTNTFLPSATFQRTGSSLTMFSDMSSSTLKVLMTELILKATLYCWHHSRIL